MAKLLDLSKGVRTKIAGMLDEKSRDAFAVTCKNNAAVVKLPQFWRTEIDRYMPYLKAEHYQSYRDDPKQLFKDEFQRRKAACKIDNISDDDYFNVLAAGMGRAYKAKPWDESFMAEALISAVHNGVEYLQDIMMVRTELAEKTINNHSYSLMSYACKKNNLAVIREMIEIFGRETIQDDQMTLLVLTDHAIQKNHIELLDTIDRCLVQTGKMTDDSYFGYQLEKSAEHGHLKAINRIVVLWGDRLLVDWKVHALIASAKSNLDVFNRLYELCENNPIQLLTKFRVLKSTVQSNDTNVLNRINELWGNDFSLEMKQPILCVAAVRGNRKAVSKMLELWGGDIGFMRLTYARLLAYSSGHYNTAQCIADFYEPRILGKADSFIRLIGNVAISSVFNKFVVGLNTSWSVTTGVASSIFIKLFSDKRRSHIKQSYTTAAQDLEAFLGQENASDREEALVSGYYSSQSNRDYLRSFTKSGNYHQYDAFYAGVRAGELEDTDLLEATIARVENR